MSVSQCRGGHPEEVMVARRLSWCVSLSLFITQCQYSFVKCFEWVGYEKEIGQPVVEMLESAIPELPPTAQLLKFPQLFESSFMFCEMCLS